MGAALPLGWLRWALPSAWARPEVERTLPVLKLFAEAFGHPTLGCFRILRGDSAV